MEEQFITSVRAEHWSLGPNFPVLGPERGWTANPDLNANSLLAWSWMGKMLSFHFSSSYEDEQVMDEVVKVPLVQQKVNHIFR